MIFHSVLFQQLWRVNICLACTGLHVVKKPATVSSQSQTAFPNRAQREDVSASNNAHVVASFALSLNLDTLKHLPHC